MAEEEESAMSTSLVPGAMVSGSPAERGRGQWTPGSLGPLRARTSRVVDYLDPLKSYLARHVSPDGPPTIESVARAARCSVRTVQRRLREGGLTYTGLLDEVRLEIAAGMLEEEGKRVRDIAFDLGYSDQANFTRAFRRWAGVCPSEFRRLRVDRQELAA
jgi:AraC-like DNA-binding protein